MSTITGVYCRKCKGMTTSWPQTNRKGVWSVDRLYVVLYAHNTIGIFLSQSSLSALHILVSPLVNVLLNASIDPFD